jgi:predicted nucleic acid-binding protein
VIVLDTTVVSELMRPSADAAVLTWLAHQARGSLVTTAITVAEIRFGLARLVVLSVETSGVMRPAVRGR